ncbi:MAG: carboxymuconolactone decarboxylase family protein, partial [Pseudomonadota bacterium]
MTTRANYFALSSKAMELLLEQENYLKQQFSVSQTVPTRTWELVKLRVSQINQCAFCIDMHATEAQAQGETAERIIGLNAWRDMPLYNAHERVALDWAEHLTSGQAIDDERYRSVTEALGDQAVVDLTLAINAINSWNRVA